MHYYPFYRVDYLESTCHLNWHEDCAYRRLLDMYFGRRGALPADVAQVIRLARARTRSEKSAVRQVLNEFFTLEADGWRNRRADALLAEYRQQYGDHSMRNEAAHGPMPSAERMRRMRERRKAERMAEHGAEHSSAFCSARNTCNEVTPTAHTVTHVVTPVTAPVTHGVTPVTDCDEGEYLNKNNTLQGVRYATVTEPVTRDVTEPVTQSVTQCYANVTKCDDVLRPVTACYEGVTEPVTKALRESADPLEIARVKNQNQNQNQNQKGEGYGGSVRECEQPLPAATEAGAAGEAPRLPSLASEACVAMKAAGATRVNPTHPKLLALLQQGAGLDALVEATRQAVQGGKGDPFAYALAVVQSQLNAAQTAQPRRTPSGQSPRQAGLPPPSRFPLHNFRIEAEITHRAATQGKWTDESTPPERNPDSLQWLVRNLLDVAPTWDGTFPENFYWRGRCVSALMAQEGAGRVLNESLTSKNMEAIPAPTPAQKNAPEGHIPALPPPNQIQLSTTTASHYEKPSDEELNRRKAQTLQRAAEYAALHQLNVNLHQPIPLKGSFHHATT